MKTIGISAAILLAVLSVPAAASDEPAPSGRMVRYHVPLGETRVGDAYLLASAVNVEGTHRGDLVAFGESVRVGGEVTGDLVVAAQSLAVDGTVGDSVRACGQTVTINGTVRGSLLVFGASLVVGPNARVTGELQAFVQSLTLEGAVDGSLRVTGGEVTVAGTVGGNARIRAEAVHFAPEARIAGDLDYSARTEADLAGGSIVAGAARFEELREESDGETEEDSAGASFKAVFWWAWSVCGSFLVGVVALLALRRAGPEIAAAVGRDWAGSFGIGFITAIVAPVAALLVAVLFVTIPLSILVLLLYVVALYVAKLPVAVWAGGRLLRLAGRAAPSPFASLAVGVPVVYAAFEIPYVGWLAWFVCLCSGLGAILLGARTHLRGREGA